MGICLSNYFQEYSSLWSYLKIESGGMLIVESKGSIKTDISSNQYPHNLVDMSYGSKVQFKASNYIELNGGLYVERGGVFSVSK
jgi:hypothetical protein